jgi:copper chaperone CopZ
MSTYEVNIPGMHCMMCVNKVTKFMMELDEVEDVEIDLETRMATVTSEEPLSEEIIKKTVSNAGYEATSIKLIE